MKIIVCIVMFVSCAHAFQKPIVAIGATAISFIASRYLKSFVGKEVLERCVPYLRKEELLPYTIKYALTAGASHVIVYGIKVALWRNLYKQRVDGTGTTSGPQWLNKAWILGDAFSSAADVLDAFETIK